MSNYERVRELLRRGVVELHQVSDQGRLRNSRLKGISGLSVWVADARACLQHLGEEDEMITIPGDRDETYQCVCGGTSDSREVMAAHGQGCVLALRAERDEIAAETAALRAEVDALRRFKTWVHEYLDANGVPYHPPGTHGAEGCRIGDRLDWMLAEPAALRERVAHLQAEVARLEAVLRVYVEADKCRCGNWEDEESLCLYHQARACLQHLGACLEHLGEENTG